MSQTLYVHISESTGEVGVNGSGIGSLQNASPPACIQRGSSAWPDAHKAIPIKSTTASARRQIEASLIASPNSRAARAQRVVSVRLTLIGAPTGGSMNTVYVPVTGNVGRLIPPAAPFANDAEANVDPSGA